MRERSSTNCVNHKHKLSNKGMGHSGTCGAMCIKEHTKFSNACFANSVSIKTKRGTNFRAFLISPPTEVWPRGHNGEKIHSADL